MTSQILTILTVAALLTATLSGFLGMGGGMVLLGVMALVLPPAMVVPIHGAVQLCSNGTRSLLFLRDVNWKIAGIYALPSAAGLYAATWMWQGDKLDWFKPLIGVFILLFLVYRRYKPSLRNVPLWVYAPVGLVVGFLAIFVGAVGPFLAPFFLRDDFKKENVIATKSVCQLWVHFGKLPAFFSLGFDYGGHLNLLGVLVVAVVVGTYAGKMLLGKMSESFFLKIFQVVLAGIALLLIVDGFGMW